jgi:SAM-dependent methyltransferase
MSEPYIYDTVPYPSMVFEHIRPDQIGAISILHGVCPEKIEDCRVLELGCCDGANLLSIAYTMPDSYCVGVDLSARQIAEAKKYAETIGLQNVEFHHLDLLEFEPEKFGKFDFIIAHGVYSWVPEPVREKLLWIYDQSLKPTGVGFISYNTYPGWHIREVARHAMLFQTEFVDSPSEKAANGIRFLEFLAEASTSNKLYRLLLEQDLEYLKEKPPESVFHDDLESVNQPFYFRQFVEQIEKAGLQFISELEPMSFFIDDLPAFAQEALGKVWNDPIRREQYLDLIRGRFFRSTLVCRPSANPSYRPMSEALNSLYLSSQSCALSPASSLTDHSSVAFSGPKDSQFETDHPLAKSLLGLLGSRWPERLSFSEILKLLNVGADTSGEMNPEIEPKLKLLQGGVVKLIHAGILEPRCFRPQIALSVSQRPKVSDLARWQACRAFPSDHKFGGVTNMHGSEILIGNDSLRELIVLADGTYDRSELAAGILEKIDLKKEETFAGEATLPKFIDTNLEMLARSALLVG